MKKSIRKEIAEIKDYKDLKEYIMREMEYENFKFKNKEKVIKEYTKQELQKFYEVLFGTKNINISKIRILESIEKCYMDIENSKMV